MSDCMNERECAITNMREGTHLLHHIKARLIAADMERLERVVSGECREYLRLNPHAAEAELHAYEARRRSFHGLGVNQ